MPGTTPIYGFPYPLGSDPVRDGDNDIRALAEDVETVIDTVETDINATVGLVRITSGFTVDAGQGTVANGVITVPSSTATVSIRNCFTAGFFGYRFVFTGYRGTAGSSELHINYGPTPPTKNVRNGKLYGTYTTNTTTTTFPIPVAPLMSGNYGSVTVDIYNVSTVTPPVQGYATGHSRAAEIYVSAFDSQFDSNAYTDFFFSSFTGGTINGGEIRIYGYRN